MQQGCCKLPDEVAAYDALHHRAQQESQYRTQAGLQGFARFPSTQQLAYESAEKGTQDDAPGQKEQSDEGADQATPCAPFAAAAVFGSQEGDEIIEHLDDDDNAQPYQQLGKAELYFFCKVEQQQSGVCQRRTGQHGKDAAGQTCQQAEGTCDDKKNIHNSENG